MLLAPIIVPVLYALDTAVEFAFTANVAAKNNFLTPVCTTLLAALKPFATAPDLSPVTC